MEFACKCIYVPPSTSQKDAQKTNPHVFKRSALLPPVNKVRPRIPPPPPPSAASTELKPPLAAHPAPSTKTENEIKGSSPSPPYENTAFHPNLGTPRPQQSTPTRRTALLPPTMRPSQTNAQSQPTSTEPILTSNFPFPGCGPSNHVSGEDPSDPEYTYIMSEGGEEEIRPPTPSGSSTPPPLPPRPWFLNLFPDYMVVLPSTAPSPSSSSSSSSSSSCKPPLAPQQDLSKDKGPLPGNPNVILISLGKLLSEEKEFTLQGEPTSCSQCGSVLESCYDNVVERCYFCQSWEPAPSPSLPLPPPPLLPPNSGEDSLFFLSPDDKTVSPDDALLILCVDISGSMSVTCQVFEGHHVVYKSRLQCVQEAVMQSVQKLSGARPHTRVGLITFNNQVTLHGYEKISSRFLWGSELMDSEYLKEAAFSFPSPPPLSRTRDDLQREVLGLVESGATALGPAAVLAIAMASRHPGSKVIICTDGKANTGLGNLEVEDSDARALLSSTIFYQDLGEYAACQGVTVSVLSMEGTDCRLDELGKLADRTGGDVVIVSPHQLHTVFEDIIENRAIATHCSVALLLPKALRVRGEKQAGHRGTKEVGNVVSDTEITFQFGARDLQSREQKVSGLAPGSHVSIQLQVSYRKMDGRCMLRVLTVDRELTDDSVTVLSSLSCEIIQLNSSQACAALAVRGRFLEARREGEAQMKLLERSLEHNRSVEDSEIYKSWVKTMDPINNSIHRYTRKQSVLSDSQTLTDQGAELLFGMKNTNRGSLSLQN
ncbi:circularly permutated Ras protein 1 isoform X2 [Hypomesus transpacificus]|uniref:circularly permutated Ras protein 1 isoform X2 n=1 Tax=Hypomesus transpacificus TaxID=137520 RepID=UPI001F07D2C3|nr:circularly permutated Ras protein 1 isoform X2 [Hypomesus transpacificus]